MMMAPHGPSPLREGGSNRRFQKTAIRLNSGLGQGCQVQNENFVTDKSFCWFWCLFILKSPIGASMALLHGASNIVVLCVGSGAEIVQGLSWAWPLAYRVRLQI